MLIKSLTIKNFRCFDKGVDEKGTMIELNEGLTAFIGRNGSGKTAILEALNFLIGSDYLPTKISEKDFHKNAKGIKSEDAIIIEGEMVNPFFIDVDVISNTNISSTVIVPCNKIRLFIKRREKAEKVLDDPFRIEKTVVPVLGNIEDSAYQSQTFKKSYKIISLSEVDAVVNNLDSAKELIKNLLKGTVSETQQTDRFYEVKFKIKSGETRQASFPSYSLTFNPNRIKGLAKSYYLAKDRDKDVAGSYSLISKILTDLHWRYKKKRANNDSDSISQEYNTLAESLRNIVDEKGALIKKINDKVKSICCDDKDFKIDFIDIDQPYKSAFVSKREDEKLLLPDNLGSGFNILIAYALFAYVADQEKIPIVLLVDEPELHLHSDWQKKMYDVFSKQSDLQIICSTQSENFISLKSWRQIRALKLSEIYPTESILNNKITSAKDNKEYPVRAFLDAYAKRNADVSIILRENLELFFTRKCILVEGPGDKYALPKLLKLAGCDLNSHSVSIIPVWGKTKIKIYQMICKSFGIDFFTIFDSDKKDDEPENENSAIETNADSNFVKFSSSLEKILGISGNDNKFQKLVKKIDDLKNFDELDLEIKSSLGSIKGFIES